ncbi:unnamed protein product [Rhodiola kirilowii]
MADTKIRSYEDFVKVHALLLAASGIPNSLHFQLYRKLSSDVFDAGNFFHIEPCHSGKQRRLVFTSDYMEKESNLFLVDHAWSFRLTDAPKQLQEVPGLVDRMASLMCVDIDLNSEQEEELDSSSALQQLDPEEILKAEIQNAKENGNGVVRWIELEDLDLDDDKLLSLDLDTKFPELYALSLRGNNLHKAEIIVRLVTKFKSLRALWLNDNPVLQEENRDLEDAIIQGCPRLEVLNSHFTNNYGEWALGYCGGIYDKDNSGADCSGARSLEGITSLDLSSRGIHYLTHKLFSPTEMPHLSYLNLRENPLEQNSCHELLSLLKDFTELQTIEVDVPGPLGENAWEILESIPNISMLNGVNASKIIESKKLAVDSMLEPRLPEWTAEDSLVVRVLNAMWLYLMTYRLADDEKLDETSVWYMMDELGSALRHSDIPNFRVAPFLYMPKGNLKSAEYQKYCYNLQSKFSSSSDNSYPIKRLAPLNGRPLRVYTDVPQVEEFLTRPEFSFTSEPKDANIIWTCMQIDDETKKITGITDDHYLNQFPYEACLVMKHHLAQTVQRVYGQCEWFQPTYNLETDLSPMIGDYFTRKKDGLDNLWILKPWNMARTIDTTVTDDLSAIIRLMETGPKICQKYIEHPALFRGRKFDLRYIVLVRSISPLEIFLCDVFWARLSNNPYSLDKLSFYEYETHFTVMNYGRKLNHMNTPEFVKEFEVEHQVKWLDIHERIKKMIKMLFEAAALVQPDMHNPKSRAIYGVDVMLDSSFQPKLLEPALHTDGAHLQMTFLFSPFRTTRPFSYRRHFHRHLSHSYPLQNDELISRISESWFLKVVYTLCVTHHPLEKSSDFFAKGLTSSNAYHVITRFTDSQLAFRFVDFTRNSLNLSHSINTYNFLVTLLSENRLHELAQLAMRFAKEDGIYPHPSAVAVFFESLVELGKIDEAKRFIIEVETRQAGMGVALCNVLLNLLVKMDRVAEAVSVFREFLTVHCRPDTCSFNIVMRGLSRAGKVGEAFDFFNDMEKFGCRPDIFTYNALVDGLCRVNEVNRARDLLKELLSGDDICPNVVTYTSLISGYCKLGRMEEAITLFDEMIQSDIKPNIYTFNVLIDGFGKDEDMLSAGNMYEKMLLNGCAPNVITFTSLIDGYCKSFLVEQGLKLWEEMGKRNLPPNVHTFCVIIHGLCRENRLPEAHDFLRLLKCRNIVPKAFVYNPIIDGYCKSGNVDEANAVVTEMEEMGSRHDKITYTILMIGHCMKGRFSEAIGIFNKMLAAKCTPDDITVKSVVSCLLKAGMVNEAYRIKNIVSEDLTLEKSSAFDWLTIELEVLNGNGCTSGCGKKVFAVNIKNIREDTSTPVFQKTVA